MNELLALIVLSTLINYIGKGGEMMKRTYVDFIGDYYDNLEKVMEWGDEIDRRVFNPKELVQEKII